MYAINLPNYKHDTLGHDTLGHDILGHDTFLQTFSSYYRVMMPQSENIYNKNKPNFGGKLVLFTSVLREYTNQTLENVCSLSIF